MPKADPLQNSFSAGEFSPLVRGLVDIDRYKKGLDTCLNYIPALVGYKMRRPGTYFVKEVKDSTKKTRLIEFKYGEDIAYVLELGDLYVRFYTEYGQVESSPGVPMELILPYTEDEIFDVKYVQIDNYVYFVHPNYLPRFISLFPDGTWDFPGNAFDVQRDGPYLDQGYAASKVGSATSTATMTPFAATGTTIIVDASSTDGINEGDGFLATDVGRLIRMKEGGVWGWCRIVSRTNSTRVYVDIISTLTNTSPKTEWNLGVWSDTTGWPSGVTVHEDRLSFFGVADFPQRIDMSETGFYANFNPTELDGTILDTSALAFTLNSQDVNKMVWALSDEKGLTGGSISGEWIVRPSALGEPLTPTNISAQRVSTYGSANIQALKVGAAGLFIQRAGRKLREFQFYQDTEGYQAADMTLVAEHISQTGITQLTHQKEPHPIVWATRTDGVLIGCTYERQGASIEAGWHRHIFGGSSDAAGSDAKVESVAVIPSPDTSRYDVWVVLQIYVDGAVKRYVCYMKPFFEDTVEQKDGFFVDAGLTYDDPKTISGATKADPCVITATSHGFSDGDKVLISDVKGMSELNTNSYLVANQTTHTFELTDLDGGDIDSSAFTVYVSGGEVRKYVSTVSGLSHLEGETVSICADGADGGDAVVASGVVTLAYPATTVHVGLGYNSDARMLRIDAGSATGTAIGKTRRIDRVAFMMHRSLGLKVGPSFDELDEWVFRDGDDTMSRAPGLFTGIKDEEIDMDYDLDNQICWRQDRPLPSTILAVAPQMITQDR